MKYFLSEQMKPRKNLSKNPTKFQNSIKLPYINLQSDGEVVLIQNLLLKRTELPHGIKALK